MGDYVVSLSQSLLWPLSLSSQLHQLLTEQLQDDLLDDSVSTVTTEEGEADTTLNAEDEVGVALDHVITPNQSCHVAQSSVPSEGGTRVDRSSDSVDFHPSFSPPAATTPSPLTPPHPPQDHHSPLHSHSAPKVREASNTVVCTLTPP